MEKPALKLVLLLFPLLLVSCRGENSSLQVLRGNYLFNRGDDVLATYSYLKAGKNVKDPRQQNYLNYNLGSVFLSLGEGEAAVEELERSLLLQGGRTALEANLQFRAVFNLGIARYDLGEYRQAAELFARALTIDAASWDAKINLELALKSLRTERISLPREQAVPQRDEREESGAVLERLHAKEVPVWEKSQPDAEDALDW
jgi:tetratricopeptide (TPR) repeat protein